MKLKCIYNCDIQFINIQAHVGVTIKGTEAGDFAQPPTKYFIFISR